MKYPVRPYRRQDPLQGNSIAKLYGVQSDVWQKRANAPVLETFPHEQVRFVSTRKHRASQIGADEAGATCYDYPFHILRP